MKSIYLSVLSVLSFLLGFGQSPVSLTNSNMPSSGDTLRYSNAKLSSIGNYTQTGTNYTWNFSSLVPSSQGTRDYKAAFQTPYAFFFIGFNEYGEKIADTVGQNPFYFTNFYNFYKKQTSPNAYVADGVGLTYNSIPVPSYYSDRDELYNFPLTYPKYDSTTFKFSTATNTQVPVKYSKTGYRVTTVDGWGSITTPYGTASCIRLVTTQYSMDSIKTQFGNFGFPNNQRSYQWMTTGSKIPFLEINGPYTGTSFTAAQARYRDSARTIVGMREYSNDNFISVYPNPVKDKLYFSAGDNKQISVELFSLTGELIRSEAPVITTGSGYVNVAALKTGVYMVKITQNESVRFLKFIKE
jgi:hypothetical protein